MHKVYGCHLTVMALCSMSGQNGYSNQTMYNVFTEENENESDDDIVTTITQTAPLTAAPSSTSTLKGTAISAEVAAAINQLSANQTTMMAQMVGMTMASPTAPHTQVLVPRETFHVPPIPQVVVPMHQPFTAQELKGVLARGAEAAVWVTAKAGADVEVKLHTICRCHARHQSSCPTNDQHGTIRRRHRTAPSSPRGTVTMPQRRVFEHLQTTHQLECVLQLQV
jgi:hypothetical protein